jgi:hypothetical protein
VNGNGREEGRKGARAGPIHGRMIKTMISNWAAMELQTFVGRLEVVHLLEKGELLEYRSVQERIPQ